MSRSLIPSLVVSDPRRSLDKRNLLLRPMNVDRYSDTDTIRVNGTLRIGTVPKGWEMEGLNQRRVAGS
jgi:hypothetical protein